MRVARNYLLAGMAGVYLWSAASIPMRREALATESFSPTLYAEKDPSPGVRQLLSPILHVCRFTVDKTALVCPVGAHDRNGRSSVEAYAGISSPGSVYQNGGIGLRFS